MPGSGGALILIAASMASSRSNTVAYSGGAVVQSGPEPAAVLDLAFWSETPFTF